MNLSQPEPMTLQKDGQQALRSAFLGQNPCFRLYLDHRHRHAQGLSATQLQEGTHTVEDAADFLRQTCGVCSRVEIDHRDTARAMLDRIVNCYQRWERAQRRVG